MERVGSGAQSLLICENNTNVGKQSKPPFWNPEIISK